VRPALPHVVTLEDDREPSMCRAAERQGGDGYDAGLSADRPDSRQERRASWGLGTADA
jgi:hypothetical protein